jgi:hypothetical protein
MTVVLFLVSKQHCEIAFHVWVNNSREQTVWPLAGTVLFMED